MKEGHVTTYGVRVKREHLMIVIGVSDGDSLELEVGGEGNHHYLRTAYLSSHEDAAHSGFQNAVYHGPIAFQEQRHGRDFWNTNPADVEKL